MLTEMIKQNLHAWTIEWGMGLKWIQHYDKYKKNEGYHLGDHGTKEEVSRQKQWHILLMRDEISTRIKWVWTAQY